MFNFKKFFEGVLNFCGNDAEPEIYAIVDNGLFMYDTMGRHKVSVINCRSHTWWTTLAVKDPKNHKLVKVTFNMEDVTL